MSQEVALAKLQADFERLQEDYQATLELLQEQSEQVETLTAKVSELQPEAARAPQLAEQLRGLKHKGALQQIAEKLGVRKEAVEDLWKLGEWKAEDDEPDLKKMEEHFSEVVKARDYLKGDGKPGKLPADENGARGSGSPVNTGKIRPTREQLNDPDWMDKNMKAWTEDPGLLEIA